MAKRLRSPALPAVLAVTAVVMAGSPSEASASRCADHPNQASAQRAKDTRDADGDGIYCEALPCPCLKPGQSSPSRPQAAPPRREAKPRKRAQRINARVTSVVDGDAIRVRAYGAKRRYYSVRLLGIDAPETRKPARGIECGGLRATGFMIAMTFTEPEDPDLDGIADAEGGDGLRVVLRTDPSQSTFDRYGRLLAYVDVPKYGLDLGRSMVEAGHSRAFVYGGKRFGRYRAYRAAQIQAEDNGAGAWGYCSGQFHSLRDESPHCGPGAALDVAGTFLVFYSESLTCEEAKPMARAYREQAVVPQGFSCTTAPDGSSFRCGLTDDIWFVAHPAD